MRKKDFASCVWLSVLVISLPTVCCSGWKPIVPPEEYYATTPKMSVPEYPFLDNAGEIQAAETQVKSTLLSPAVAFNHEKSYHQSNKKLDVKIFKPTEVTFFPSGEGKSLDSPLRAYHEVIRESPSSFFSFKYGGPRKTTKTIYYGDLELAKPKFTSDIKYYKPFKQSLKTDVKVFKPASFLDNDVSFYQSTNGASSTFSDHCSLYKTSFRQDLYYQYIQYKVNVPELKEFTLCLWMRFHNQSHDHSLFSYGVKPRHQAIYMWVSNLNEPALFNMKVLGQTIFRLNYPIKLYKWYHTCQSWNGITGEWQVWVNSHRIARGFHNLLVNHPIPGGGVAISGQEHRHFGKGFQEIPHFLKGTGGLEGEITMLQMYKIALTAGKAYNDHSHHHSHYTSTTTEPPELPTDEPSTTTDHPLLENGQLKKHVNILELAEALKKGQLDTPDHFDHHSPYHHFSDVPLSHSYVGHAAPLAVQGNTINFLGLPNHAIFKRNDESEAKETSQARGDTAEKRIKFVSNVSDHVQVEKIKFSEKSDKKGDEDLVMVLPRHLETVNRNFTIESSEENISEVNSKENDSISEFRVGKRLKRHNFPHIRKIAGERTKRITPGESKPWYFTYGGNKGGAIAKPIPRKPAEASKRQIHFEDSYLNFGPVGLTGQDVYPAFGSLPSTGFSYDPFPHFGTDFLALNGNDEESGDDSNNKDTEKEIKKEVELAEGEVRRIMELCSGCHADPFRKVAVISWRSTPKKIYSGTLFLKAKSECENF